MGIHIVRDEIAVACGVNSAMILEYLKFWTDKNKANKMHYHNGMWWTYESTEAFCEQFPFFTGNQIRSAIDKLISFGYIVKGNFNQSKYNRTLWYAITEKGYALFHTAQNAETSSCENPVLDREDLDVGSQENPLSISEFSKMESGKSSDRLYISCNNPVKNKTVNNPPLTPPVGGDASASGRVGGEVRTPMDSETECVSLGNPEQTTTVLGNYQAVQRLDTPVLPTGPEPERESAYPSVGENPDQPDSLSQPSQQVQPSQPDFSDPRYWPDPVEQVYPGNPGNLVSGFDANTVAFGTNTGFQNRNSLSPDPESIPSTDSPPYPPTYRVPDTEPYPFPDPYAGLSAPWKAGTAAALNTAPKTAPVPQITPVQRVTPVEPVADAQKTEQKTAKKRKAGKRKTKTAPNFSEVMSIIEGNYPDCEGLNFPFSEALQREIEEWLGYKLEQWNMLYQPKGLKNLITTIVDSTKQYGEDLVIQVIRRTQANGWQGITWDNLPQMKREKEREERNGNNAYSNNAGQDSGRLPYYQPGYYDDWLPGKRSRD